MTKPKSQTRVPNFVFVVDRASFIAWTMGILLDRKVEHHPPKHDGELLCDVVVHEVIGDTLENREAEKVLKKGGTVMLTVGSKPFSLLRLDKKQQAYVETRIPATTTSKRRKA